MNEHAVLRPDAATGGYDDDFFAWTQAQAALLRGGRLDAIDIANIAEEIESLGKSRRRELYRRMLRLLEHLIKLDVSTLYDPRRQWILSVSEQRRQLAQIVEENPSLRPVLGEAFEREWPHAAALARGGLEEFDHDMVPDRPSFGLGDALDENFIPE